MNILQNKLIVIFDEAHNRDFTLSDGTTLLRPDGWIQKEQGADGEKHSTWQENTNYLETKPQIATVTHGNSRYPYKVGDKVFLHYMAHVSATYFNEDTKEAYVDASYVFFTYGEDGSPQMATETYFGEQVYSPDTTTPNGIILIERAKQLCQVRLTHLPPDSPFSQDEIILTIDNYQYPVDLGDGVKRIMLREHEIVARIWQDPLEQPA